MHDNFTIIDLIRSLEASAVFPVFIVVPGFVIGWAVDLFHFRARRIVTQLLLSVPLSLAICPILTFLLQHLFGVVGIWLAYGLLCSWFIVILSANFRRLKQAALSERWQAGLLIVLAWAVVALGSLVDVQVGDRLYFSIAAYDLCVRTAFTGAVTRGMPPVNPFFAVDAARLRYHYLWMLMCSLPTRLAGIGPRQSMFGGTIWMGIAVMSIIALYIKFFFRTSRAVSRTVLLAIGLLAVTGLDLIPTTYLLLAKNQIAPDMDWWNVAITSWIASLIWVPHYVGSFVACLMGLLILWEAGNGRWKRVLAMLLAGAAFASAVGMGVYVAFTFAIFCVAWILFVVSRKSLEQAKLFAGAGVAAFILAIPYLGQLRGPAIGGNFAGFGIRAFSPTYALLQDRGVQGQLWYDLVSFGMLPLNYFLELGFFFGVGWLRLREIWHRTEPMCREEMAAWIMVATSFIVGSFTNSRAIPTNDLGLRAFLPAQFILLLWAAMLVNNWWFDKSGPRLGCWVQWPMAAMLALGLLGTVYQMGELRLYPILLDRAVVADTGWLAPDEQLGRRTFALRRAYEDLETKLPGGAVIQHNPSTDDYLPHLLYSNRPAACGMPLCGTSFGGDPKRCLPIFASVEQLFAYSGAGNATRLDAMCKELSIDVVVVKDTDAVWTNRKSWVWTRQPLLANNYVRAFACGVHANTNLGTIRAYHPQ